MKIIGHRGARGLAAENTSSAITRALDYHVDEVEFDVRVTKDGVVVLSHDATLRTETQKLTIADQTFAELRKAKPGLDTLGAALDLIKTRSRPHIEIKPGEPIEPIVAILKDYVQRGKYSAKDLLVGSNSFATLREFHQAMPDIELVVIEKWSGVRASLRARRLSTKRISMRSWWLWRGFLRSMQRRGYLITPYTMNNPAKVKKWQPYIYGVITDFPDRFVK
jgi:glycerophosphoryl diester phosphodiesterase